MQEPYITLSMFVWKTFIALIVAEPSSQSRHERTSDYNAPITITRIVWITKLQLANLNLCRRLNSPGLIHTCELSILFSRLTCLNKIFSVYFIHLSELSILFRLNIPVSCSPFCLSVRLSICLSVHTAVCTHDRYGNKLYFVKYWPLLTVRHRVISFCVVSKVLRSQGYVCVTSTFFVKKNPSYEYIYWFFYSKMYVHN